MITKLSEWVIGSSQVSLSLFSLLGFHVVGDQLPSVFILATESVGCARNLLETFSLKTWYYMWKSYFLSPSRNQNKSQKP